MNDDRMPPEPQRPQTEHLPTKADGLREAAEQDGGLAEEFLMSAEAARNESEQSRRLAEEAREDRDHHRQAGEGVPELGDIRSEGVVLLAPVDARGGNAPEARRIHRHAGTVPNRGVEGPCRMTGPLRNSEFELRMMRNPPPGPRALPGAADWHAIR